MFAIIRPPPTRTPTTKCLSKSTGVINSRLATEVAEMAPALSLTSSEEVSQHTVTRLPWSS